MTSLPGRGALHAQMLCRAYSCQNNRSGQPSVSGRPVISSAWPRRAVRRVPVEFTLGSGDFEESCNELIYVNPRSGVVLRALSTSGPDDGELTMVKDRAEIPSKARLWLAAAKPPMYTVAIAPVFVAAALAKAQLGFFPWAEAWALTWPSILVILWLNLSNDAFDADTSVDVTKAESVVNLLGGAKQAVLLASVAVLGIGGYYLATTVATLGGATPLAMLGVSIACGYVYQGPPFRLSYKGLGEPLCFVAFGPLATVAFHLCLNGAGPVPLSAAGATLAALPPAVWGCSVLVGLTTTAVLFCSHFHQVEGDLAANKFSPIVRMGTETGSRVLLWGTVGFYALLAGMVSTGALPLMSGGLGALSMIFAAKMVNHVTRNHDRPEIVRTSKFLALRWHVAFFALLCMSLAM